MAINRMQQVKEFAKQSAILDRKACALAETKMDGEWTGEHSTALAEHLGCRVRDLTEDDFAWAAEAYADEAQRDEVSS